jgi:hypothetical protein
MVELLHIVFKFNIFNDVTEARSVYKILVSKFIERDRFRNEQYTIFSDAIHSF